MPLDDFDDSKLDLDLDDPTGDFDGAMEMLGWAVVCGFLAAVTVAFWWFT